MYINLSIIRLQIKINNRVQVLWGVTGLDLDLDFRLTTDYICDNSEENSIIAKDMLNYPASHLPAPRPVMSPHANSPQKSTKHKTAVR